MSSQTNQKPAFDFLERVFHMGHIINMIILLLSGFQIHSASFNIFGAMGNARVFHFFFGWFFLYIGLWHTYRFYVLGTYKTSMPHPIKNRRELIQSIKYYLFIEDSEPISVTGDRKEYGELQKLTYTSVFIISGMQIVLGFFLYWPETFMGLSAVLGGLQWVRYLHYLIAWMFVFFTMVHLYMVFVEGLKRFKKMILGKA